MAALTWDGTGERLYETGVDHGVLFVADGNGGYGAGVAWNGLTAVNESPEGAEPNALYADNIKYLNLMSNEEFNFSIESYTYPPEFGPCIGEVATATGVTFSQQARKEFGFSYRTKIGNDVDGENHGYKLHLVYGCLASAVEKAHNTINDSPEAETFSFDVTTTPIPVDSISVAGVTKPVAHIVIDSTTANSTKLTAFLDTLYGSSSASATLPTLAQVISAFSA